MTSKVIENLQTISLRPQNEVEQLVIQNIQGLVASGKVPKLEFRENGDMLLIIRSTK